MNKKRLFELFIVTFVFLFLHVSTFANEKFNDKLGSFTFIVLLLMFYISSIMSKRINLTCC
ncbi:hypothetical protein [Bacillus cereus]|uniref:hypothetical protein n=1 Tax=Bacillus cereus TaxID=1396 RepID=UPI00031F0AF1|nr:hypothetical protein [Bacillus cereus]